MKAEESQQIILSAEDAKRQKAFLEELFARDEETQKNAVQYIPKKFLSYARELSDEGLTAGVRDFFLRYRALGRPLGNTLYEEQAAELFYWDEYCLPPVRDNDPSIQDILQRKSRRKRHRTFPFIYEHVRDFLRLPESFEMGEELYNMVCYNLAWHVSKEYPRHVLWTVHPELVPNENAKPITPDECELCK